LTVAEKAALFSLTDAARIARAVRTVEIGDRRQDGVTFRQMPEAGKSRVFRICTFTGAWSKTSAKTVSLKYQTTTPNTFVATNLFANISASTAQTLNCAIAREGTAWFLIAAECDD